MAGFTDDKRVVAELLEALATTAGPSGVGNALDRYCDPQCSWGVFAPFDTLDGTEAAASTFWEPVARALPGWSWRPGLLIAGEFDGGRWVSTLGHLQGNFEADLVGIPATWGVVMLRFGLNALVRDGRIVAAYVLLDVLDLMRQAGWYPFRPMLGSPEQWPAPPPGTGSGRDVVDPDEGARTLDVVRRMQDGLGFGESDPRSGATERPAQRDDAEAATAAIAEYWSPRMNWYGPAGIGSARGYWGYQRYHADPFERALPDYADYSDDPTRGHVGPPNTSHHYVQLGDGKLAVTSGWPSIIGTLSGPWLGAGPAHRPVAMRVADWYRLGDDGRIVDNWVMIDLVDALRQGGLDVLADLRYRTHPETPRWPR